MPVKVESSLKNNPRLPDGGRGFVFVWLYCGGNIVETNLAFNRDRIYSRAFLEG